MNKVTIETDTQIITGSFLSLEAIFGDNKLDYTLQNMHDVTQKTKNFQWNIMFHSDGFNDDSHYLPFKTEKDAKYGLKVLLKKVAYRTLSFDGEKIVLDNGYYYIDREQV